MSASDTPRTVLAALASIAGILALVAVATVWGVTATPASERALALAGEVRPETEPSTSTSSSIRSTTTSTSTSTTVTSTTVKPAPVTTRVPVTVPVTTPPPTAPPTTRAAVVAAATGAAAPVPAPSGRSAEERCAAARDWAASRGLRLPAGWGFRCPSKAIVNGVEKWGLACWNCEGTGSWIAVDVGRIGASDATLRHVVAHEICHAVDYETTGMSSEPAADACAASYGAPR